MQKEEAIKAYDNLARFGKTAFLGIATLLATVILVAILTGGRIEWLYICMIGCVPAIIVGEIDMNLKVKSLTSPTTDILVEELDKEKHLEIVEGLILHGKDSKRIWLQKPFYLTLQLVYDNALYLNNKKEEAENYLEKSDMDKKSQEYAIGRACIDLRNAYELGNAEKYTEILSNAPKTVQRMENYICVGLILQGKYDEAIEVLNSYPIKSKQAEIQHRFYLAQIYLKKGMPIEAKPYLEYVINNGKTLPEKFVAEELYKEL